MNEQAAPIKKKPSRVSLYLDEETRKDIETVRIRLGGSISAAIVATLKEFFRAKKREASGD